MRFLLISLLISGSLFFACKNDKQSGNAVADGEVKGRPWDSTYAKEQLWEVFKNYSYEMNQHQRDSIKHDVNLKLTELWKQMGHSEDLYAIAGNLLNKLDSTLIQKEMESMAPKGSGTKFIQNGPQSDEVKAIQQKQKEQGHEGHNH